MPKVRVLFVCLGNICRSPTAEGVFRHQVNAAQLNSKIEIDSAGTSNYHIGEQPDLRSQQHALLRGYDLSSQRARQVDVEDFFIYDLILAMDESNLQNLHSIAPPDLKDKAQLFLNFAESVKDKNVPDPYWSGTEGFEQVLDLIEQASKGLLQFIRKKWEL
jgi:protein-tyrosine phosphatase